jgi:hypothetical protein
MTDAPRTYGDTVPPVGIGDRLRRLLASGEANEPLYPRLLRLRHVHPNGWQRAALVEGTILLGALAALADRATSWAPVILPVATAVLVKFHDVLVGLLPRHAAHHAPATPEPPDAP